MGDIMVSDKEPELDIQLMSQLFSNSGFPFRCELINPLNLQHADGPSYAMQAGELN
jgi:hypothetical protein